MLDFIIYEFSSLVLWNAEPEQITLKNYFEALRQACSLISDLSWLYPKPYT